MSIVQVENVSKIYGKGDNEVVAVNHINLSIEAGEFVAIVGTSGSGKTTLLQMMGGIDKPTDGIIRIGGQSLYEMDEKTLTVFRRKHIGFIFQNYNLIPSLNVRENIILPLALDDKKADEDYLNELADVLDIREKLSSKVNELSGGQQQRVAIARALLACPDIVLADEPTGNLDSKNSIEVMQLFLAASSKYRQSVVMITHDAQMAAMANRIIRIEDGKIYE